MKLKKSNNNKNRVKYKSCACSMPDSRLSTNQHAAEGSISIGALAGPRVLAGQLQARRGIEGAREGNVH